MRACLRLALTLVAACAPPDGPGDRAETDVPGETDRADDTDASGADDTDPVDTYVPTARVIGGCTVFPDDNVWYTRADRLPVLPGSAAAMAHLAASVTEPGLKPGASASVWEGSRSGIPFDVVDGRTTPSRTVAFLGPWAFGTADYPMPAAPRIEGEPNPLGAWDRHVLLLDTATCTLHELQNVRFFPLLAADGAATYDLASNDYDATAFANAEAASLPILPALYTYEEVEAGEIRHALRAAIPMVRNTWVWPARSTDGRSGDAEALPMGARVRLKADADLSALGPQARVIATALKRHGLVIADTTVDRWGLTGVPDERWDDADLRTLSTLVPDDFEWVDASSLRVDEDSLAARAP